MGSVPPARRGCGSRAPSAPARSRLPGTALLRVPSGQPAVTRDPGRGRGGVPVSPGTSLALLPGLAPPPGVRLVPAAACVHSASARFPHPACFCQRFPLLLFLLLRPSPPLRTPLPPSTPRAAAAAAAAAPPALLRLPPAYRSRSPGCCSQSLSPLSQVSRLLRIRAKGGKHPILLAISGKVAHVVPIRDLASPFTFASHERLISPHPTTPHSPMLPGNPGGSGRPLLPSTFKKQLPYCLSEAYLQLP